MAQPSGVTGVDMGSNSLIGLLMHERTRHLMGRLSQGDDPRRAVAEMAGQTLAQKIAQMMGTTIESPKVGETREVVQDAEYVVIDVSPGVKKRTGKEK